MLKRVDHDAGEIERANVGRGVEDVVAERATVVELHVLGKVEEIGIQHVGDELGVDAGLEVDRRQLAGVHATCRLDFLELLKEPGACLVRREGDEGDVERRSVRKTSGPGEELVVVHTVDEGGPGMSRNFRF
jgi:hypothetical protein